MLKHSDASKANHGFPFQVQDNNILKKRKEASLIPGQYTIRVKISYDTGPFFIHDQSPDL